MKKRTIIFTALAGMIYIGTTSYHGGAAADGSLNRTGAQGSISNCAGSGCHTGTSPLPTARIYIDSAGGVPVTKYTPGKTYTIRVAGSHSVNDEFGFQFAAVSGTTSQIQAGTFGTSLPSGVGKHTLSGLDLIEHTDHIATISPADSFVKSFTWTAPATNVGNITLHLTVNAINGNHMADMNDVSSNTTKVLQPNPITSDIADLSYKMEIIAFPNPVVNQLHLLLNNENGGYNISVTDMYGRSILNMTSVKTLLNSTTLNTADWPSGMYNVKIEKDNKISMLSIVKY